MAKEHGRLPEMTQEQWNELNGPAVRAFLDSLPDAEGTFGGHLVTDACYRLGGCGPGCPPGIRVDAAKLAGHDGIRRHPHGAE